jgi:hypothetical protein
MWTSTWVTTYCKQNFFDTAVGKPWLDGMDRRW